MNYYAIVSGGTGSMCIRALIFLFTAMKIREGMDGKLYIRVVDMDKRSDAAKKCRDVMECYDFLRRQTNGGQEGGLRLPEIVLENWNFYDTVVARAREEGIDLGDDQVLSLKNLFTYDHKLSRHDALLLNTFFENTEQEEVLDQGFYGHPNIGSVVFNYVREDFLEHVGNEFMKALYTDLEGYNGADRIPVYLYGSLFGGTGASVTPNLIDILESITDPAGKALWGDRMRIGITMMMPYFKLPDTDGGENREKERLTPDSLGFFHQTREALQYYDTFKISEKVESLLLLGQKELCHTSEIYARGEKQYQHFHVILLAAAVAGYRFFESKLPEGVLLWKISDTGKETLFASDLGLQNEERKLQEFFRFSVVVSQYMSRRYNDAVGKETVYERLNAMPEIYATIRTFEKEKRPRKKFLSGWDAGLKDNELDEYYREPVNGAVDFCRDFIRFYFDLALSGYDWTQYHDKRDGTVTDTRLEHRLNHISERMVDLLNIQKTDEIVEESLSQDIVNSLKLNVYFEYISAAGEERKSQFADKTVGGLYTKEMDARFKHYNGENDRSFSEVYAACYEAAKLEK